MIEVKTKYWCRVQKANPLAVALADRHYSRITVGSKQFMPPGQTIVLISWDAKAVFGWWRPDPQYGFIPWHGYYAWTCTIFRNEGPELSSELILDAERVITKSEYEIQKDGLITYVWDSKIKSINPGFCFKKAGYKAIGRSSDNKKTLLQKPKEFVLLG